MRELRSVFRGGRGDRRLCSPQSSVAMGMRRGVFSPNVSISFRFRVFVSLNWEGCSLSAERGRKPCQVLLLRCRGVPCVCVCVCVRFEHCVGKGSACVLWGGGVELRCVLFGKRRIGVKGEKEGHE